VAAPIGPRVADGPAAASPGAPLPYAVTLVALTDEQRAMLQLLLAGGQGYEDIGSLLGIAPDEVRTRARAALQEIGGADPDAQVGLTDFLLGQADPIGRADAIRHLQSDPDANALAERLVQNLQLLAPSAQLPEIPDARGGRKAAPPPLPAAAPSAPTPAVPPPPAAAPQRQGPGIASRAAGFFSGLGGLSGRRRTQLLVGIGGAVALIVIIIIVAASGGGGGGQVITVAGGDTKTVGSDCKPVNSAGAQQAGVPTMKLLPAGAAADADCPPSGQITLGSAPQSQQTKSQVPTFVLQANAVHLQPTSNDDRYLLWLYKSDSQSVPLGQEQVDSSGNLTGAIPIPAQELLLIPAFQQIRFSKVTAAQAQQVQQALANQGKKPTLLTSFVGDSVLQGNVSDLGLAQLLQQAQAQAQAQGGSTGQVPQGNKGTKG
jgi:hypothetical protein